MAYKRRCDVCGDDMSFSWSQREWYHAETEPKPFRFIRHFMKWINLIEVPVQERMDICCSCWMLFPCYVHERQRNLKSMTGVEIKPVEMLKGMPTTPATLTFINRDKESSPVK